MKDMRPYLNMMETVLEHLNEKYFEGLKATIIPDLLPCIAAFDNAISIPQMYMDEELIIYIDRYYFGQMKQIHILGHYPWKEVRALDIYIAVIIHEFAHILKGDSFENTPTAISSEQELTDLIAEDEANPMSQLTLMLKYRALTAEWLADEFALKELESDLDFYQDMQYSFEKGWL